MRTKIVFSLLLGATMFSQADCFKLSWMCRGLTDPKKNEVIPLLESSGRLSTCPVAKDVVGMANHVYVGMGDGSQKKFMVGADAASLGNVHIVEGNKSTMIVDLRSDESLKGVATKDAFIRFDQITADAKSGTKNAQVFEISGPGFKGTCSGYLLYASENSEQNANVASLR